MHRAPAGAGKSAGAEWVVLVHGLWMGPPAMALLARRLTARGFHCAAFRYPTVGRGIAENAVALERFLVGIETDRIHLVGHSLGGLVILVMLAQAERPPVGRVVLLGTPVAGSHTARRLARWGLGRRLLARSRQGGTLEDGLRGAGATTVAMIAGGMGWGLGRLLGALPSPSDGTVAVAETLGPMVAAHATVGVSHSGLLLSARVARAVARYLRDGVLELAPRRCGSAARIDC